MKKILSLVFVASTFVAVSQPKKAPKMAPILAPGYYVTGKNDTVRGEIQTNPEDETSLYTQFNFRAREGAKVAPISVKKALCYGFEGRDFVQIQEAEGPIYVERLTHGRLNLFEYKFNGKVNGYPGIEVQYYAQDTRAEGEQMELREVKKISSKFYKRDLRPYMKDQPMIWSDLDKFTLNRAALINAFNEFNSFYVPTAD